MSIDKLDEAKKKIRFTGAADYREVFGQEFTHEESRQAADISDVLDSTFGWDPYGEEPMDEFKLEMIKSFISEDMLTGHRLYMILHLPIDQLGVMAMKDSDDRLVKIIKERCSQINKEKDGRSRIILPSEF